MYSCVAAVDSGVQKMLLTAVEVRRKGVWEGKILLKIMLTNSY